MPDKNQISAIRLRTVAACIEKIAAKLKHDEIYAAILESICDIISNVKVTSVLIIDKTTQQLEIVDSYGLDDDYLESFKLRIDDGVTGMVARTGKVKIVKNVLDLKECPDFVFRDMAQEKGLGPLISVPLKIMESVIGVINVYKSGSQHFRSEDSVLLEILASQAAVSIQSASLYQQKTQQHKNFDLIYSITRDLASTLDIHLIINKIFLAAQKITGSDKMIICYRLSQKQNWRYKIYPNDCIVSLPDVAIGQGIVGHVIRTAESYMCKNVKNDDYYFETWGDVGSEIATPLFFDGQVWGVLDVQSPEIAGFNKLHLRLLSVLAEEAAIALRAVQLFSIADRKNQELISLAKIGEAISHEKSLAEILNIIADASLEIVGRGNKVAFVVLKDPETNMLKIEAGRGEASAAEYIGFKISPSERSIVGCAARNGRPKRVPDVRIEPEYLKMDPQIKSELAVPLFFRKQVIGVIDIESTELNAFDEHDEEMLQVLADNAAIAAKIGELFEIRLKQLEALYKTGTQISSSLDLIQVLQTLAEQVLTTIGAEDRIAYVQLFDKNEKKYVVKVAVGINAEKSYIGTKISENAGISGWVVRNRHYRICPNVKRDSDYCELNPEVQSEICVPILFATKVTGLINVESLKKNDFGANDRYLLEQLAHQASVAIKNAQLAEKLANTQFQLNEALELALIGEVLSGLSHDIRTCSSLIAGEAQWISYRCDQNTLDMAELIESMEKVESFVKRIETHTEALSQRTHQSQPQFTQFNLKDIMSEILPLTATKAQSHNVQISTKYSTLNLDLEGDIRRLKRVFLNVIINAIDAMKNGGNLMIEADVSVDSVNISFKDTGIGIPDEFSQKIWERFYTTKEQGTGLGLTICRGIIENDHNGSITIQSAEGKGTTVTIRLPIKQKK